jgi:DNA polymerase
MVKSRFVVIGQNPGYNECRQGEPFVGKAGENFDKELAKHGLLRDTFYITNILHCYTPKNRPPTTSELLLCRPIIEMEISYLKPRLIVTLGKFAFRIMCPGHNYSSSLGKLLVSSRIGGVNMVLPIYHPSGQNLAIKVRREKFEADVATLAKYVKEVTDQNG